MTQYNYYYISNLCGFALRSVYTFFEIRGARNLKMSHADYRHHYWKSMTVLRFFSYCNISVN